MKGITNLQRFLSMNLPYLYTFLFIVSIHCSVCFYCLFFLLIIPIYCFYLLFLFIVSIYCFYVLFLLVSIYCFHLLFIFIIHIYYVTLLFCLNIKRVSNISKMILYTILKVLLISFEW